MTNDKLSKPIDVKIIKEKRKTLSIKIVSKAFILVKAPLHVSNEAIQRFIDNKTNWIHQTIKSLPEITTGKVENDAPFFFLGKYYTFLIKQAISKEYVKIKDSNIIIYAQYPDQQQNYTDVFLNWLKQATITNFKAALTRCLKQFPNLSVPKLRIRPLKSQWGNYHKKHRITLNIDLIAVNPVLLDFIITHELCHCYHFNHSAEFYNLLEQHIPLWKQLKTRLNNCPIIRLW